MSWLGSRVLRSARPFVPSGGSLDLGGVQQSGGGADDQAMLQMMSDLVLGEIQAEIERVQKDVDSRRQMELQLTKQPDYSWLMDWKLRAKQPLGFRESTEVELLCAKVCPGEWRRLLSEWRTRVRFVDTREAVLASFRAVVNEVVGERMQRQCSLHSVDEHSDSERAAQQQQQQEKKRPKTARSARFPFPSQLSVFTLTLPDEEI